METVQLSAYPSVVIFTGAGMSAESGVPTYRGSGGIWAQYNYEEYACQAAFDARPEQVLAFHEMRRAAVLACEPHAGHHHLAALQSLHPKLSVVTQNIDGLLQRAGIRVAAELHGSLWRMRCPRHGISHDALSAQFAQSRCPECDSWLRPDITWFGDNVNAESFAITEQLVSQADLFVSVGTSGVVWPAAGFAQLARNSGAHMIEINPEDNEASALYRVHVRKSASEGLAQLFPLSA
tara:strand:- start:7274 stop:7984 length:711 start_codon:yes stop_codon:yes gene_type:complete